jgi:hypothetical protein
VPPVTVQSLTVWRKVETVEAAWFAAEGMYTRRSPLLLLSCRDFGVWGVHSRMRLLLICLIVLVIARFCGSKLGLKLDGGLMG